MLSYLNNHVISLFLFLNQIILLLLYYYKYLILLLCYCDYIIILTLSAYDDTILLLYYDIKLSYYLNEYIII